MPRCRGANRNGGRHCCQPPLRRARICRCSSFGSAEASPSLDPGSPAQASLPTAAARESLAFSSFPSRREFRLGPLMPCPKTRQLRCSTALLGMTTSTSRFARPTPKSVGAASRKRKIISSGASCRLVRSGSISPTPTRRTEPSSSIPSPAGGDRSLGRLPHRPVVSDPWRGWNHRPDHLMTMHFATSRAKRNMRAQACG